MIKYSNNRKTKWWWHPDHIMVRLSKSQKSVTRAGSGPHGMEWGPTTKSQSTKNCVLPTSQPTNQSNQNEHSSHKSKSTIYSPFRKPAQLKQKVQWSAFCKPRLFSQTTQTPSLQLDVKTKRVSCGGLTKHMKRVLLAIAHKCCFSWCGSCGAFKCR